MYYGGPSPTPSSMKGFPKCLDTYQPLFLGRFYVMRTEIQNQKLSREIDQSQTIENGMYLIE